MKNKNLISIHLVLTLCLFNFACSHPSTQTKQKELLIYCGITMIKPMREIANVIERQESCKITITKDGSGNLLKSIRLNKIGDLFLPGSESYISKAMEEGLITKTIHVGYNKAAIMVKKGNPKNIPPNLSSLTNPDYYVIMGNPESGSIGKETKKILEQKQIYSEVLKNTKQLTTDSKDLTLMIKEDVADLTINWFATATWHENTNHIEALPIDKKFAQKKKLILAKLIFTTNPNIVEKLMNFAASEEGKAIFLKHGLYHIQ